jgi:hypothetical protein
MNRAHIAKYTAEYLAHVDRIRAMFPGSKSTGLDLFNVFCNGRPFTNKRRAEFLQYLESVGIL